VKGPLGVGLLNTIVAVAPGARHACARKNDGSVWCWGKNDRGQLGDGTKVDSLYPVKVTGLP
jgi:alpha-tubulin suppressor-like RCC1 family protein